MLTLVFIRVWIHYLWFQLTSNGMYFALDFSYRGGVDSEGRPVMVVVGAHFLLRCLDLERFVLHVVKVTNFFHVSFSYAE